MCLTVSKKIMVCSKGTEGLDDYSQKDLMMSTDFDKPIICLCPWRPHSVIIMSHHRKMVCGLCRKEGSCLRVEARGRKIWMTILAEGSDAFGSLDCPSIQSVPMLLKLFSHH